MGFKCKNEHIVNDDGHTHTFDTDVYLFRLKAEQNLFDVNEKNTGIESPPNRRVNQPNQTPEKIVRYILIPSRHAHVCC